MKTAATVLALILAQSLAQDAIEVTISDIQGSMTADMLNDNNTIDLVSPLLDQLVSTTGIVIAANTERGVYFVQALEGDDDPTTSDAIQIFRPPTELAVGDVVALVGTVSEFYPGGRDTGNQPTTQLSNIVNATVLESGQELPEPVVLEDLPTESMLEGLLFWEALEAMRVTAPNLVAVAGTNRFGENFGVLNDGSATGISQRGTLNISPDDFNPEKIQVDEDDGIFAAGTPQVKVGATFAPITGVVGYSFGNYEIIPTEPVEVDTPSDLEPTTTELASSETTLLVGTYNVLNLDPNDDDGDTDVANGRFETIANHIVSNMNAPDIVALQEIQDDDGSEQTDSLSASTTLQTLIDAIAAADGPAYEFADNTFIELDMSGGQPGANIRTAFLYNPERVTLSGVSTISGQAEGEAFFDARLPLVGTFRFIGNEVTIVNVHFSSKGGSAPIVGTTQPFGELQEDPAVNGGVDERTIQASAVRDFVVDKENVIVLGDFNEFEFVSPVSTILGGEAGLVNLADKVEDDGEIYSFIFQGNSQALDHILVSEGLFDEAAVDYVHVNCEFPSAPALGSDHDPLVATLMFERMETEEPVDTAAPVMAPTNKTMTPSATPGDTAAPVMAPTNKTMTPSATPGETMSPVAAPQEAPADSSLGNILEPLWFHWLLSLL